jgi:hypothetical protein
MTFMADCAWAAVMPRRNRAATSQLWLPRVARSFSVQAVGIQPSVDMGNHDFIWNCAGITPMTWTARLLSWSCFPKAAAADPKYV